MRTKLVCGMAPTGAPLKCAGLHTVLVAAVFPWWLLLLTGASGALASQPPCPVSAQSAITCYPPSQVKQAEKRLPVKPVDPSPAVAKVTGSSLTLVFTVKRLLPTPSKRVTSVVWEYGIVPDDINNAQPATPAWVMASEDPHQVKGLKGMRLWRNGEDDVPGTWHLLENLPDHKLSAQIVSNVNKATIRRIGQELIRVAAAGVMPARAAHPSLCGENLGDIQGSDVCFPPSKLAVAEGKLPVRPVHPVAAVAAVTGLRLTQIELREFNGPFAINYLFGRIPAETNGFAALGYATPRYVIVAEHVGRIRGMKGGTSTTSVTDVRSNIYWTFHNNFRCHNLTFQVTSNIARRVPKEIGQRMVAAEHCGVGKG